MERKTAILGLLVLPISFFRAVAQNPSSKPPSEQLAQVSSGPPQQAVQPPPLPITTQIKKTIVFLESDCVHDFNQDALNLTREKVLLMQPTQQAAILNQLKMLTMRLRGVKPSMDKLSVQETARLFPNGPTSNIDAAETPDRIDWMMHEVVKMTTFTEDELSRLSPLDLSLIPLDQYRGTGFFVGYKDSRLKPQPGDAGPRYFRYLVTNRHVVQPGIENGTPCKVVQSSILLNHKPDATHPSFFTENDRIDNIFKWTTPQDESVDLAVTGIGVDDNLIDTISITTDQFVTDEDIKKRAVVEGDPVLFAGLFIQTFDQVHTLEPIVRSGSVAMIPEGKLRTVLNNKMGHIYLAEAHAFHGNSGSPVFVDPSRFAGSFSLPTYKLLGVISGEMTENSDLTLTVTTSISANIAANSDVSMMVPASEVVKLLDDPILKAQRDKAIGSATKPEGEHAH